MALGPAWDNMIWVSYGSWSCEHHSSTKSWMSLLLSCGGQWATVSGAFFLSEFRNYPLFLLFQFVETRPVFTMPRPEVSRSLRVNYLPGFTDLSP